MKYRFHDGSLGHLKLKGSSLRFLNHDPNQSALVFDGFSLRPDSFPHKIEDGGYNNITNTNKVSPTQNTPALQARFPKELRTVIARLTELQSLHKRVVSSANWLSLSSF